MQIVQKKRAGIPLFAENDIWSCFRRGNMIDWIYGNVTNKQISQGNVTNGNVTKANK